MRGNLALKPQLDSGPSGQEPTALALYRAFVQRSEVLTLPQIKSLTIDLVSYLMTDPAGTTDSYFCEFDRIPDRQKNYEFVSSFSGLLHNVIVEFGYQAREFESGNAEESWGHQMFSYGEDHKIIRSLSTIRVTTHLSLTRMPLSPDQAEKYRKWDFEQKSALHPMYRGKVTVLEEPKKQKFTGLLSSEFGLSAEVAEEAYSRFREDFLQSAARPRKLLSVPDTPAPVYEGIARSGDIFEFLREHYPHREGAATLSLSYLREHDPKGYRAYYNRKRREQPPEDLQLPTRADLNDAFLQQHRVDLTTDAGKEDARKLMGVINGRLRFSAPDN